jgi:hypothetical protein
MEITLTELLSIAKGAETPASPVLASLLTPGAKVLIRTVTHIQTGIVVACDGQFVRLSSAAWIADTGRFADALASGLASGGEVEPFAADCVVSVGAIIDATTLPSIPTAQR